MITLKVGARLYEGWKRVEVTRAMDRATGAFSLAVSDKPWPICPGDKAAILIDDELVLTGWVDSVRAGHDADRHEISASGRSLTSDLVDCSAVHSPGQWKGQKLEKIAEALAKPFGIEVVTKIDTGGVEVSFQLDQGQSVHDEIERLCRKHGVLVTDDEHGRLVITRAAPERMPAALTAPGNVLAAEGEFTLDCRFSHYVVKGQAPDAPNVKAEVKDPSGVGRYRPLLIRPDATTDLAAAREMAQHEAVVRFGRAATATVTVAGWRAGGELWRPNRIVHYTDKWLRLDRDMLISAVTFSLDADGGEITRLSLVRDETYKRLSDAEGNDPCDRWVNPGAAAEIDP